MKVKNRLNELTKELYIKLKRKKYTDEQISKLYRCSHSTLNKWKIANGIPKGLDVRSWEAYEFFAPEEIERMKKKYLEYEAKNWKVKNIGEMIGLSEMQTVSFRKRYFPDRIRKERRFLTDEEAAQAESVGVNRKIVARRICKGWTLEQAISIQKGYGRTGERPWTAGLKTKRMRNGDPVNGN